MKAMYKVLLLSLLFFSCKISANEGDVPQKKVNILERTRWKSSTNEDSLLDFYTSKNVKEYIFLNGREITREGTYKLRGKVAIEIKWGKRKRDEVTGVITGKEMKLQTIGLKDSTTYYKIKEY